MSYPPNILACFTVAVVLGWAAVSQAKPYRDCPPGVSPTAQIAVETWHGTPLAEEYYLNPRGVWFKLPFGYINPWPSRDAERLLRQRTPQNQQVLGLKDATGVSFAFWMPSLRWPERDRVAEDTIADVEASGLWPGKVVTEVTPVSDFWEAEPEHQNYLERYPNGYTCHFPRPNWKLPKREEIRQAG